MNYRMLGRTGQRVSEISLGAWALGGTVRVRNRTSAKADPCGYGHVEASQGAAVVRRALELGINLIDTAPIYGDGASELRVADALAEADSEGVLVCTKSGVYAEDGTYVRRFTRDVILREVEKSRERLRRDVLDIELLHSPTADELGDAEAWDALLELKDRGVVRFIGVSIHSDPEQARAFILCGACDVLMLRLNLLDTAMRPVLKLAHRHGVGVMARECLGAGFLTGRFDAETRFAPDDQRSLFPRALVLEWLRKVDALRFLESPKRTMAQAALQWVLTQPGVTTIAVGASTAAELEESVAVCGLPPLTPDELERIEAVLTHEAAPSGT